MYPTVVRVTTPGTGYLNRAYVLRNDDLVSALLFGAVKRGVGGTQDGIFGPAMLWVDGNSQR